MSSPEVHAINEQTELLARLINDIGTKLKTWAVCSGARRLRYGIFTPDQALVVPQWRLDPVVDAMDVCRTTQYQHRLSRSPTLTQLKPQKHRDPSLSSPSLKDNSELSRPTSLVQKSLELDKGQRTNSISDNEEKSLFTEKPLQDDRIK